MAPGNSMLAKTWLAKKATVCLNSRQNGPGAKARAQSPQQVEPCIKTICDVEATKDIAHSLFDFSKLVSYFI